MFIGEYHHSLDQKGRIAVPVRFRPAFAKGAVVTRGIDNCLSLYTKEAWEELADKISKLPISKSNTRAFARLMLTGAMEVELDKQGRIILPDYLRSYAELKKKTIIAGVSDRLEIWDATSWEQYKGDSEKSSSDIAEALDELSV
ncbi:division/cell wall cluster transcriptional repressor MraZ [Patescibacteria group bacterium]